MSNTLNQQIRAQSKSKVLGEYVRSGKTIDPEVLEKLKKKPIRTLSGVTPVTVLTKPYPCPGECIFCPVDVRMPKSYIANEPGAQRAGQNGFDPYLQAYNRLKAYREIGHPTSKIELIVLGGTWSAYPEDYQIWFIKRLFDALNDFGSNQDHRPPMQPINLGVVKDPDISYNHYIAKKTDYTSNENQIDSWERLLQSQRDNETALCRCVGLVLETRPDYVTADEVYRLRRLGATKIQIGIQSLSDSVLKANKRGHTVVQTAAAINLLRQAGFKIHAHWMPNLYGSNPADDLIDFDSLFTNPNICPDELKIYPCSLIEHTQLMDIYHQGDWTPYTLDELTHVLTHALTHTPEYCRLTRIIRDIPGTEIVAGNKTTNLRQLLEAKIDTNQLHDIRAREIGNRKLDTADLKLDMIKYSTTVSDEYFLQYITANRHIAAFLRLSLPTKINPVPELQHKAIIREVHVYGQSITVGQTAGQTPQHSGLGKKLITQSIRLAKNAGYQGISVISAIGTREYYAKQGFSLGELYQHQDF